MQKVTPLCLILFFVSILAFPQGNKLDKYFQKKTKKAKIVGLQAAYVKDGQLAWKGSFGKKRYDNQEEVNDQTLFMIASCTKPVTTIGFVKLVDKGVVSFDDDINDYLPFKISNPNFPDDVITFRMLLTHTSSIRDNWDVLQPLYTTEEGGDSPVGIEELSSSYFIKGEKYYNAKVNFWEHKPGSKSVYCNMGYVLTAYVIELITGQSFPGFMQEIVFEPMGMTTSYWFLKDIPHDNIASPHEWQSKKSDSPRIYPHYGYADYPDGQLRTTVTDYARVLELMVNDGKIKDQEYLKLETAREFTRIQFPEVDKYQALTWDYNEFDNWLYYLLMKRYPSHTGYDPGITTVTSFDPKTGNGAVVFSNTQIKSFKQQKIFYQEMVKRLMKEARK